MYTLTIYRHGASEPTTYHYATMHELREARRELRRTLRRRVRRPTMRRQYGELVSVEAA